MVNLLATLDKCNERREFISVSRCPWFSALASSILAEIFQSLIDTEGRGEKTHSSIMCVAESNIWLSSGKNMHHVSRNNTPLSWKWSEKISCCSGKTMARAMFRHSGRYFEKSPLERILFFNELNCLSFIWILPFSCSSAAISYPSELPSLDQRNSNSSHSYRDQWPR